MFLSFREILNQFLSSDVFFRVKFGENNLFHCSYPWFWFKSEKHWNVVLGRIPHAIVKQSTADDVGIELQIFPIFESEIFNSVEQFLLFLYQDMFVKCLEYIIVFFERLVENKILNPSIFNNIFFSTSYAMFINLQDHFSFICLGKEANGKDVSGFEFMNDAIHRFLGEWEPLMQNFGCFRSFRTENFEDFDSQCFMWISYRYGLPLGRGCLVELGCDVEGHSFCIVIS